MTFSDGICKLTFLDVLDRSLYNRNISRLGTDFAQHKKQRLLAICSATGVKHGYTTVYCLRVDLC